MHDVIVIGAGVAGLACARGLSEAGRQVLVVERSRGVGGRCATRRFDGQPVDLGPMFLHGDDPAFLAAVDRVPGGMEDWPRLVDGVGAPCQPEALQAHQRRVVFAAGLSAFPKQLAEGLHVQLSTTVAGVDVGAHTLRVRTVDGAVLEANDVVVALPVEQSLQLLAGLAETVPAAEPQHDARQLAGACALLRMFVSVPCLTLVAGYDVDTPALPWDVQYPADSECLQLIAHDSNKRASPAARVLVLQARPRWSRQRLELPGEAWGAELLAEAATRLGAWAASPRFTQSHRWRLARVERGTELRQPLRLTLSGGQRVGVAGEVFAPGGGVQAAWLSGTRLAERLLQET